MTARGGGAYTHLMVNTITAVDTDVKRVFRQHRSLVVVVPMYLRKAWDLKAGDYIVFEKPRAGSTAFLRKFEGSKAHGRRGKGHSDRGHSGR